MQLNVSVQNNIPYLKLVLFGYLIGFNRFGCAQCDSWFVDYSILRAHIRVHTKERPFQCDQCDSRFSQESNLRRHVRTHTGERPFACKECGKKFSQGNNLKAHMIVHSGIELSLLCTPVHSAYRTLFAMYSCTLSI